MWFPIVVLMVCIQKCLAQIQYLETNEVAYEIAGIFERNAVIQRLAFNESMRHAQFEQHSLIPVIMSPPRTDSYSVWRELCRKSESMRPIAIVGPQNAITDGAVRDQCAIANIPHIQATWQPFDPELDLNEEQVTEDELNEDSDLEAASEEPFEVTDETEDEDDEQTDEEEETTFKKITINFYPNSDEITFAYAQLLKYYGWKSFAAVYEDDYGLLRIQKILAARTEKYPITLRKLDPDDDNYDVFKDVNKIHHDSRVILDCHVDRIDKYMKVLEELDMVNPYQQYIFLTIDSSMLAERLSGYRCSIIWLSLMDYDEITNAQHVLVPRVGSWTPLSGFSPVEFPTEALLMDDIANHVLKAARALEIEEKIESLPSPTFTCDDAAVPWNYGAALQKKILETQTTGVTGNLQFDPDGNRINYNLYVNEIHLEQRDTIGHWDSSKGGDIIEDRAKANQTNQQVFKIISRKAEPYFFDKVKCEGEDCPIDEHPNNKYAGFSVDLVEKIFEQLRNENYNYTYEFIEVPFEDQRNYGTLDPKTNKWNGLIGYLLDNKADLAVFDLTITEERKKVVDFSVPFMTLGISILYTKEHKVNPGMFSFLYPYTFDVWMYTATAYCLVSIALFVCSRISPADWENPQPCDKDPEELENIWNFKNCAWLTMGSIMTQGCDILPKAFGTRWVCGMWWFFAVIVCQTYIAQLSASMTSALELAPINSAEDLAKQTKIRYGAIGTGSTFQFFKNSQDKTYRQIYEYMEANPGVLVNTNEEGVQRVIDGKNKYAFFMESSSIDFKLKRNCELKKVGGELDSKDYGIAMPANSPFRSQINAAILKLKELTILAKIKEKWWEKELNATTCDEPVDVNDVEGDLEVQNLIGAFVVLIVGLVFALFITAAEFMNEVRNIVVREQVTHKEAFVKELKASLNFFQLQKPVQRNPSRAPSIAASEKSVAEKISRRVDLMENFLDFEKQEH